MSNNYILLTIDVEDWFQVENFRQCIPFSSWPSCELRVEKNTHRLLDLLDSIKLAESSKLKAQTFIRKGRNKKKSMKHCRSCGPTSNYELSALSYELDCRGNPKATFFVLGWIAERLPRLVREIQARGHEVASHGYHHRLCTEESRDDLKKELMDSRKLLEDIIGAPVWGYRAPSFAVNEYILNIIEKCGYLYDSSFNSFGMHGRYGKVNLSQNAKNGIALHIADPQPPRPDPQLHELPISNLKLGQHVLPWGGGGYFRLMPSPLFKMGVKSILKKERDYLFYMHPWEVDPEQPRVEDAPRFFKFRHYINLQKTAAKLSSFIEAFKDCRFVTCKQYLDCFFTSQSNLHLKKDIR